MPLNPKETVDRIMLSAILAYTSSGCIQQRQPIKNVFDSKLKITAATPEFLYLSLSTPEELVAAMGICGENVLLSLANSGILSVDMDSQLTGRQVGLMVENMRNLTSATSTTDLGPYRFYLGNYLATDANTNDLMAFTAASSTLTKLLLLHWSDINWPNDTIYQRVKGVTNRVDASVKKQVLNDFILTLERFTIPLGERQQLSSYSLTIVPENAQEGEHLIKIDFEGFMNGLESLRQGHDINIAEGVPSV